MPSNSKPSHGTLADTTRQQHWEVPRSIRCGERFAVGASAKCTESENK
jgi:hypothetical protein